MQQIDKKLFDPFLNKKRIFGIHGGGNIGLGCMADIVSRSPYRYHIVATSSDKFYNNLINISHQFWLRHPTKNTTKVTNVTMIDPKNKENIIWLYVHSNQLALCLTETALNNVAYDIAMGILKRYLYDGSPLEVLVLMNKINGDKLAKTVITHALLTITQDHFYTEKVLSSIKFIPTVVDRIVNKIEKDKVLNQLKKQIISLDRSSLSKLFIFEKGASFANQIDTILFTPAKLLQLIKNFNLKFQLFNAEENFLLGIPDKEAFAFPLPDIKPIKDLAQFADIKNKFFNCPHAMLAWMGGLMGCKTIAEAINHSSLECFINNLMEEEIAPILKAEYPTIPHTELNSLKKTFINRCQTSLEDPITRVGRDPLRKLNSGGRIRGLIELREKHHLKIATPGIERGMAAGILYALNKIDPNNAECQKIQEIYQDSSSYKDVLCYKGPYNNGVYSGLDLQKDKPLINNILKRITAFEKIYNIKTKLNHRKKTYLNGSVLNNQFMQKI